ncbi:unnamed protein product [Phaeothamnion confervicola]
MSRQTIGYQPALDGVRALAVSAVLVFHGGITWLGGGYLGVSVFFTLSGFLITSLLLVEHASTGRVDAPAFYARRARRLLPASLVCVAAVCVGASLGWWKGVAHLRRDVLGAVFQVFNWVKLAGGESYADLNTKQAGLRAPLDHYWSLAIEEQFYWVWPMVFLGLMWWSRRRGWSITRVLFGLVVLTAVAAPAVAAVWGPDAAYWATPARICEILVGALVASWCRDRTTQSVAPPAARWLAPAALIALGAACALFPDGRGPAYRGALPLVAIASGALILGLQSDGPVRRLLSLRPFVGLGKISYGVYLFHWPIYVLIDRQQWDVPIGVSLLIKLAITLAVALLSFWIVERPVRRTTWLVPRRTLALGLAGTAIAVGMVVIVPQAGKYYGVDEGEAAAASFDTLADGTLAPLVTSTVPGTTAAGTTPAGTTPTVTTPLVPPRPVRIAVVGDSTAEATGAGLIAWAAANPTLAQVTLVTAPGCGLVPGGFLVFPDAERSVDETCSPWIRTDMPADVAALRPDVVILITTSWDVLDRRLTSRGPVLTPLDADLGAAIAASFTTITDELLASGVSRVVWAREPIPDPFWLHQPGGQRDPARHAVLYSVMDELADNPAVRVVDLAGYVTAAGLDTDESARPDGVHWAPDAAEAIATEFLGPALVREALT